eukprot:TRINITY_DN4562_c0_g1_i1.p1 TRINITY_DN4562_c0_g1~~TRINITY_DN4562_c0_g1_i1.p1  ORF type:complete len:681 (+),score=82.03 TRINITY_DN4562_c0_g1_i1:35-2044(+)
MRTGAPSPLSRAHFSSTTDTKIIRSGPGSPLGPGREKITPRRPFKCGVEEIDIEVAVITRGLDRIVMKKLENLNAAPVLSPDAAETDNLTAASRMTESVDANRSGEWSGLPPLKNMTYIQETDTLMPNPNTSSGLEFEVNLILNALERLVVRMLDTAERDADSRQELDLLRNEVQKLRTERDSLQTKLVAASAAAQVLNHGMPQTQNQNHVSPEVSRAPSVHYPLRTPLALEASKDFLALEEGTSCTASPLLKDSATAWSLEVPRRTTIFPLLSNPTMEGGALNESAWGKILKCAKLGSGDYVFQILDDKLTVIREAATYGLQYLADALLQHHSAVVLIKEFPAPPRHTARINTRGQNLGLGLDLDIIRHDAQRDLETHAPAGRDFSPPPALSLVEVRRKSVQRVPSSARRYSTQSPLRPNTAPEPGPPVDKGRSAMDRHGIVHFVGTRFGTTHAWENPVKSLRVLLASSSVWGCADLTDLTKKDLAYFITLNKPGSWVEIDFLCGAVLPTAYSFASAHAIYAGFYPRTWELQASMDRKSWRVLRQHQDDDSITFHNPFGVWDLPQDNSKDRAYYYRYFRIVQQGPNSFGSHELQVSSFEIYGRFIFITNDRPWPAPASPFRGANGRPDGPADDPELPPPPKPPKPRGKKGSPRKRPRPTIERACSRSD